MIFQLCYTSTATTDLQRQDLVALLTVSRRSNAKAGITGLLLFTADRFVQLLEGDEAAVRKLYEDIQRDGRHRDVTLVFERQAAARECPDWSMGFQALPESEWLEFPGTGGARQGLRPMGGSADRARAMLRAVCERGLDPDRAL
jgi:hypothetical protein